MFFLLRSTFCISLVVCALPDSGHLPPAPVAATNAAVSGLTALCDAAPARCLALLQAGLKAGSAQATAAFAAPSHDTLLAADRRPAWRGSRVVVSD